MKKLFVILFCLLNINVMAQVVLPSGFLKTQIRDIEKNLSGNQLRTDTLDSNKFYWFPTIKYMESFEKGKAKFLQNNIISYNDSLSNIALYSEIASDYIGPVRVSAGISLSYPKSDTNTIQQKQINRQKFLQRFSTGGGSVVLNFILPIFTYNSQIFGATMSTGPRLSLDPPSFGVSSSKFANNAQTGTDLQAELRGIKEVFKFTGALRLGYVAGNGTFYDALQLVGNDRSGFWLNNYNIGVTIKDIFTISYTKFWGSHSITNRLGNYLTFTVSPNFK